MTFSLSLVADDLPAGNVVFQRANEEDIAALNTRRNARNRQWPAPSDVERVLLLTDTGDDIACGQVVRYRQN